MTRLQRPSQVPQIHPLLQRQIIRRKRIPAALQGARVVVLERTNARYLDATTIPEAPSVLVCDASFIGLRTVLPAAMGLVAPGGWAVALIKPQFEVGPNVAKGGVVRDAQVHANVCGSIRNWWAELPGWSVLGVEPSPLLGPEGNREFLIAARKTA